MPQCRNAILATSLVYLSVKWRLARASVQLKIKEQKVPVEFVQGLETKPFAAIGEFSLRDRDQRSNYFPYPTY